jgi:hypothetical protein
MQHAQLGPFDPIAILFPVLQEDTTSARIRSSTNPPGGAISTKEAAAAAVAALTAGAGSPPVSASGGSRPRLGSPNASGMASRIGSKSAALQAKLGVKPWWVGLGWPCSGGPDTWGIRQEFWYTEQVACNDGNMTFELRLRHLPETSTSMLGTLQ